MTRNSEWVLQSTVRACLRWCDGAVILNHASDDGTSAIITKLQEAFPDQIVRLFEENPIWNEMTFRHKTLEAARQIGGTHFANVDDDEVLTANLLPYIRYQCELLNPGDALEVPWLSMWNSLSTYRDDQSDWSKTYVTLAFRDVDGMCYRPAGDGYQHHNRRPIGCDGATIRFPSHQSMGGLMHLQFSSNARLKAKQALYKMREVIHWPGRLHPTDINKMYDNTTLPKGLQVSHAPAEWWVGMEQERAMIRVNDDPWQKLECERLWKQYGVDMFRGLDLYGVVQ